MQEPIELILVKHWASYTAIPIFIVDADGNLVYYNDSAEAILGRSFDEAGEINAADLEKVFVTTDRDGTAIANEDLPLVKALVGAEANAPCVRKFILSNISSRMAEMTSGNSSETVIRNLGWT